MNNITLISDWSLREPYLAMFKGKLHSQIPNVIIFDITHAVELLNIHQAAFILKHTFSSFPVGTIHVVLVGTYANMPVNPVLIPYQGHFFIANDDGIISLLFDEIDQPDFPIFCYNGNETNYLSKIQALCSMCIQQTFAQHTAKYVVQKRAIPLELNYNSAKNQITGTTVYVDVHHNIITNIPVEMFLHATQNKKFIAYVGRVQITEYADSYLETAGNAYFVPNSMGVLEITTYRGNIAILDAWEAETEILLTVI